MTEEIYDYLGPEARVRIEIDSQLKQCGWVVQNYPNVNLGSGHGIAVREFPMATGHGEADYLLFVNRSAIGIIEAKPVGTTLTGSSSISGKNWV